MIEIDLIRHVKVAGKPALYGCTDVAPIATENARLLKRLLAQQQTNKGYQSIVCSPLIRCHTLAQEFAALCQLPLALSPGLQEMNFGWFDGVAFDDLIFKETTFKETAFQNVTLADNIVQSKLHWSQLEAFFQAPGEIVLPAAEALSDFHHRVTLAWQKLITQQVNIVAKQKQALQLVQGQAEKYSPTPRRILVIAHGGVIRMILAHILQVNWQQSSWHQKLQIGHGSLSRVLISQPFEDEKPELASNQQVQQQLHQQVTSIAMPFLEEI